MGFKSFDEVNRLTIAEYELLMKAAELREADIDYRLHMQAFLNVQAGAKKKAGKNKERLVYNRFDKFYDRKKEIDRIMKPKKKSRFYGIGELFRKRKGGDQSGQL
mgnify:FL=1